MEYNIYSNDNSANEAILAMLNELNNIFFIEYLDSESEDKFDSIPDDESVSDDDIPLNKLNEFNFYIYHSKQSCFGQICYERFLACRTEFESLNKNIRDMVIKGQLSDLCETCETIKMDIQYTTQYKKKLEITNNYLAYLNHAQEERNYYNTNIVNTIEDSKHNPNIVKP
ncbi:3263_t:CDS:2 [Scutellospora calospora]|uniref:3263_t:CDS:1 n=1 Tax=Scutellospora calospora TaxID=85575 RepID=A0ACA9JZ63_9GLOM|nr:3263_t:CDS:2 [Scutellospora calospora]